MPDPLAFVRALNRVWTVERNPQALADYFHERMVAITPVDRERRTGRADCIAGWQGFVDHYKILSWQELDPQVDLFAGGRAAVVTYYYEMDVEKDGQPLHLSGRDMYFLASEDGRWWVVANQFSNYPK